MVIKTMANLVNIVISLLIVPLTCPLYQAAPANLDICTETYLSLNGNICAYCNRGYFKLADCALNDTIASCRHCGQNEFQPYCNRATSCAKCQTHCPYRHMETVQQCSQTADMECHCVDGFYWQQHTSEDGVCLHNKCPAGEGADGDSCKPCVDAVTFSNSVSLESCKPCKRCETYNTTCMITHDAECSLPTMTTFIETDRGRSEETIGLAIGLPALVVALIALGCVAWYCRRSFPCYKHGVGKTSGTGSSISSANGPVAFQNTLNGDVQVQNGRQDTHHRPERNDVEDNTPIVEPLTRQDNQDNHVNTNTTVNGVANENIPTDSAPGASERNSMLEREHIFVDPMDSGTNQENGYDTGDNDMYSGNKRASLNRKDENINADLEGNRHDESENTYEISTTSIPADHSKHSLDKGLVSVDALSIDRSTVTRSKQSSGYGCRTTPRVDINVAQVHSDSESCTMRHAEETNKETVPGEFNADAWIEEAEVDYTGVIEQQYQLLLRWRRVVPKSSEVDIIKTLKACQLNSLLWKFEEFLGKRSDPNHTLVKNDKSKSMPIFAQETNPKIKTENDRLSLGNNFPVMENLKEFRHDCVTNPDMENLKEFRHGGVTGELINNGDTTGISMISRQTPVTEL